MERLAGLGVFVVVAETRSFTAAGRQLGISASAVGKRVARLEDRLGVRVFHRSTRSITLTPEGQQLLERSRRILDEIDDIEAELCSRAGTPSGVLRVSLPLVSSLVLPVLSDFMQAYPQIQLDLDFSDRVVDVIEEGFDVVVRFGEPRDSRLVSRVLGDFGQRLVASPDYLARHGVPQQPSDLAAHQCLHYRFPSTGKLEQWPLRWPDTEAAARLPVSMICNNIDTRLCFAQRGRGIACLPDFSVAAALADGSLVSVLDRYVEFNKRYHLLWPSGRHMLPKLRAFVDFMQSAMRRADE